MTRINIGSGQRRFEGHGWINLDCISRPPDQVPDVVRNVLTEPLGYSDADMIALVHVLEHWNMHEARTVLEGCHQSLKVGGSLIVIVPDIRALAKRWLRGEITDFIFKVNMMGADQGQPGDIHRWHWLREELHLELGNVGFRSTELFNWRRIPGADSLAPDWWYYGIEATK
jgi:O-methyltransferase domain